MTPAHEVAGVGIQADEDLLAGDGGPDFAVEEGGALGFAVAEEVEELDGPGEVALDVGDDAGAEGGVGDGCGLGEGVPVDGGLGDGEFLPGGFLVSLGVPAEAEEAGGLPPE